MSNLPPAVAMTGEDARIVGRHVKAALMHLNAAWEAVEVAGVSLANDDPLAVLARTAVDTVMDLDLWALNNALANDVGGRQTYGDVQSWCHREGGVLPYGPKE